MGEFAPSAATVRSDSLLRSVPPAVKIVFLYIAGIVLGETTRLPLAALALSAVLLAGIGLGLWHSDRFAALSQAVLFLGLVASAALWTHLASNPSPTDISRYAASERAVVEGLVCRYPQRRGRRTLVDLDARRVFRAGTWRPTQGRVLVRVSGFQPGVAYGDLIRVVGRLRRPRASRNPGGFNYRRFLLAEGITATLSVYRRDRIQLVQKGGGWWLLRDGIYPLKDWMAQTILQKVGGTEGALIQSLVLGERGGLPEETRQGFARSGVIHVLAVSGLHVGFVILVCFAIFTLLRLPPTVRTLLTLLVLFLYVYLTNVRPSVVRAAVMGGLLLIGHDLQRRTPVTNTLALAALVILILNPLALFQASFQLSFAAVLGIVFFYRPLEQLLFLGPLRTIRRHAVGRYTLALLAVSLAAQLGTLPLSAFYFGRIPLVGLLANLLVIPLVFLVVGFAATALILTPIWPFIADLYWEASHLCATAVLRVVDFSGHLPMAAVEYPRPSLVHAGLFAGGLILLAAWRLRRARVVALVVVLLAVNLGVWRAALREPRLEIVFFDVGQGDAALVRTPTGKTLLIDAGRRWQGGDAGESTILPYLRRHGVGRLDAVVFTHAHEDHYGGFASILRRLDVGVVYGPAQRVESETLHEIFTLTDSLKIPLRFVHRGEEIPGFDPVRLFVLHPTDAFVRSEASDGALNLNEGSVVIELRYGHQGVLFTGDAEKGAERQFVRYGPFLRSAVLKVGHHGSRTSTSSALVRSVRPRFAVVSVGEINTYGLPDEEPLQRLRQSGAMVLRTDKAGAVVIRSDGLRMWRAR